MKQFSIFDGSTLLTTGFRFSIGRSGKKIFGLALCVHLFALCAWAQAQQTAKIPRIGYLTASSPSSMSARVEAFREGLRELGYQEGKNIVIEWRFADGKLDRLPTLAAELKRLTLDVIVTSAPPATLALKEAASTTPVVMAQDSDPVGSGFVGSLARPGGNITGLSTLAPEISGKQLELLKEIIPKLSRLAVIGTSSRPGNVQAVKELEAVTRAFKVRFQYLDVVVPKDIETAFRAAGKGSADAVILLPSGIFNTQRSRVVALAAKGRLPVIYYATEWVEDGGLMTYSVSLIDLSRRAASYVDKILKGAKPGDLPVEQPTKFEFIVNLKAAKQIGLTIPPNVLARADRVIR